MTQLPASHLLKLPLELHGHISIFLPPGSITNLIRSSSQLRLICEEILYRRIDLFYNPGRSWTLLRTLLSRPELALLVQSLNISLDSGMANLFSEYKTLSPGQKTLLNALPLARNIRRFGMSTRAWLSCKEMDPIRELMSKMELETLRIQIPWLATTAPQIVGDMSANLCMTLQGQPSLRELEFQYAGYQKNDPVRIENSDIPHLRAVRGDARILVSILPGIAEKLESVEVRGWAIGETDLLASSFSSLTEARRRVRKLEQTMIWLSDKGWDPDFGHVLDMFPNVDSLRIIGLGHEKNADCQTFVNEFFKKVASQITRSLNLTTVQMHISLASRREDVLMNDVSEELKLKLKSSCPSLKTFIDPAQREWAFSSSEEEERSGEFRVVKVGRVSGGFTYNEDLKADGWEAETQS